MNCRCNGDSAVYSKNVDPPSFIDVFYGTGLEEIPKTTVMNNKEQDPNLQSPQDANTTKHINFLEIEESEGSGGTDRPSDENDENNPTKKAWEELRNDNKNKADEKNQ
jgi:hypothetical protein